MKAFLWYWIIGCLLTGLVLGNGMVKCPNKDFTNDKPVAVLVSVAVWPVYFLASFMSVTSKNYVSKDLCTEEKQL